MDTLITRVFNNGNSQAVRIPAEFRLDTDQVSIRRNEEGDLVIHPLRARRGAALLDALLGVGDADEAFVAVLDNDLWIACHALAEQATLITHNTRAFQRVAGLRLENWVLST